MFEALKRYINGNNKEYIADKASLLMNNEAFLIAKESLQENLLQDFVASRDDEQDKREELFKKYKLIDDLCFELDRLINNKPTE